MSDDFWRGWRQGQFWSDILSSPKPVNSGQQAAAPGGPGCLLMLGILPLGLECLLLGGAAFSYVSHPAFGWTPDFAGLGWPSFAGWVIAIFCCLVYFALHGFWPLGLLFTVFWTITWAALFHNLDVRNFDAIKFLITLVTQGWNAAAPMVRGHDWKYGIAFGALALIGHLSLVVGPHLGRGKPDQVRTPFLVGILQTLLIAAIASLVIGGAFWLVFTLGSLVH